MTSINIRAALAADPDLGAGNVLDKLVEHGAALDGPGITFDTDVDGHPAWEQLPLGALVDRVAARAAWFSQRGVQSRDPVAVFVTAAADCFLNFLALARLGAIPALMNGNMPGETAVEFVRRLRGVGAVVDADHRPLLAGQDLGPEVAGGIGLIDAAETGSGDPALAPAPYRHHQEDPIAITHSSGTTRLPTPVVHSHQSLFAAIKRVRWEPRPHTEVRTLSVLPSAHAAGIITVQMALCNRYELLYLSAQGGEFARSGERVLDAIERWRPTRVSGFAVTWAELARFDLTKRDLSSVDSWFNTGDSAHEAHIRRLVAVGSRSVLTREGPVVRTGSRFFDGIGSTEMGHNAFHITHLPDSNRYGRCVGKPYPYAEIALFDLESGAEVGVGEVGHVGLKAPTLAVGYWNDSVNTYRTRFRGYYLTGDLMYRDEDGYYYHVDRAVDAVDLGDGNWIYTAMSEERILASCPDVRDCTVVAGRDGDRVVTDVLLMLVPDADPERDRGDAVRAALGEPAAGTLRRVVAVPDDDIVVGPTGKVRKFLMRQRHLAGVGAGSAGTAGVGAGSAGTAGVGAGSAGTAGVGAGSAGTAGVGAGSAGTAGV